MEVIQLLKKWSEEVINPCPKRHSLMTLPPWCQKDTDLSSHHSWEYSECYPGWSSKLCCDVERQYLWRSCQINFPPPVANAFLENRKLKIDGAKQRGQEQVSWQHRMEQKRIPKQTCCEQSSYFIHSVFLQGWWPMPCSLIVHWELPLETAVGLPFLLLAAVWILSDNLQNSRFL